VKIRGQKEFLEVAQKNKRGKRKKTIKKYDPKVNHVSTLQIINKRKINSP
jgi:hypothetical protein